MASRPEPKRKRRRTLYALPYLLAYRQENEAMEQLRVGLNAASLDLLTRLAKADNLADSTWFSMLAHRLLTEPELAPAMQHFVDRQYRVPLGPFHNGCKIYSIPRTLKEVIERTGKTLPSSRFHDTRGLTSAWVRMALAYCAVQEKGWAVDASVLAPEPEPASDQVKGAALKDLLRKAQTAAMVPVPCPMPRGFYEELQRLAPGLFGQTGEQLLRRYISRGLREDLLDLEMNGAQTA